MKLSRTYKNLFSNIIVQIILALSGIIIPKLIIVNFSKAIASVILVCGSVFLLLNNVPLIMVKVLAVLTHMGEAIFLKEYVKKNYVQFVFDSKQKINLEQQSSALIHQICMVITYNTDDRVLTIQGQRYLFC